MCWPMTLPRIFLTRRDILFGSLAGEEEAVARLEDALGGSPAVEEYPTAFALADALQQGACGAVLLEESYQLSLSDARGYEWTAEGMRRLGRFAPSPRRRPSPCRCRRAPQSGSCSTSVAATPSGTFPHSPAAM